jgi:hypothetical protein
VEMNAVMAKSARNLAGPTASWLVRVETIARPKAVKVARKIRKGTDRPSVLPRLFVELGGGYRHVWVRSERHGPGLCSSFELVFATGSVAALSAPFS